MRLNLKAESTGKIGYTPDWIMVPYHNKWLTLDIQGELLSSNTGLNSRIKGELIPLSIWENNKETYIDENEDMQKEISRKLVSIFQKAHHVVVGVYPKNESDERRYKKDRIAKGVGSLEINTGSRVHVINFNFETQKINME